MLALGVITGLLASLAASQQLYTTTTGATARPQCMTKDNIAHSTHPTSSTSYVAGKFRYSASDTVRYATSVPSFTSFTTYAAPSDSLTTLLPSLTYTTWGKWKPSATSNASDTANKYGQAAWTAQWKEARPVGFNQTSVYSSTVSPTPIPSSELVLPPRDYFGPSDCYQFPNDFVFGVASSASQIEGAAADEGKAPSIMDIIVRDDKPKAYVTNEHYYYYKQDIERVAAMGVKHFSFTIAWTRILPFAMPGTPVNQKAIDHYDDVINFIIEKGMVPVITLTHFDLPLQFFDYPQALDEGLSKTELQYLSYLTAGYSNDTFSDAFVNYAKIVLSHYADRVPTWFTFCQPPEIGNTTKAVYNILKAHADVYHWYKDDLKGTGQISIKFNANFGVPHNATSEADIFAADYYNSVQLGSYLNPMVLGKQYPESFKYFMGDSYIPLTAEDINHFKGTIDFLGLDAYSPLVVTPPVSGNTSSIQDCLQSSSAALQPWCVETSSLNDYGWNIGYRSQSYVYTATTFIREYINYVYQTWPVPIAITEFGFPVYHEASKDLSDQLFDSPRSQYYLAYMSEVLKAIHEDNVPVKGVYAWSFVDNWEFGGYDQQFGMQTVNRTTQERHYKKSFFDLVDFMKARGV
ncbi:glycoside hydrolase superfamily [Aspergillus caelatus]|uniref:Glycoside hydrolase superfamily n=1 Tax=Aspergillus caelatus TaxID=61420 RepID=A0A5N7A6U0_9EURO|nr:glycoside hydrolase superfamily [Aspergillus caelatus]KAE8365577.1 glycoside hydrolase superfamily [Aspergillus caelatus]